MTRTGIFRSCCNSLTAAITRLRKSLHDAVAEAGAVRLPQPRRRRGRGRDESLAHSLDSLDGAGAEKARALRAMVAKASRPEKPLPADERTRAALPAELMGPLLASYEHGFPPGFCAGKSCPPQPQIQRTVEQARSSRRVKLRRATGETISGPRAHSESESRARAVLERRVSPIVPLLWLSPFAWDVLVRRLSPRPPAVAREFAILCWGPAGDIATCVLQQGLVFHLEAPAGLMMAEAGMSERSLTLTLDLPVAQATPSPPLPDFDPKARDRYECARACARTDVSKLPESHERLTSRISSSLLAAEALCVFRAAGAQHRAQGGPAR